ncbi:MAG: hypothetical protein WAL23_10080 [Nitrososphaeraceae archaeon]
MNQVSADLKQYRLNQLKRMEQTNSTLLVDYLYSRMREGNLKPASMTPDGNMHTSFIMMELRIIWAYTKTTKQIK